MIRRALIFFLAGFLALPASLLAVTLATDDFNRTDANPIGGNWTTIPEGVSDLQIVGNEVRSSTTFTRNGAYYNAVSAPDDQWSKATIVTSVGGNGPCVAVRISASAESYYAFCPQDLGGDAFDLYKRVAGTYTSLSADFSAWADGDTIKIEAQGTTIKGYINDVEVASATDSSLASGQFGLVIGIGATLADIEVDDWEGGDFASASSTDVVARRRH